MASPVRVLIVSDDDDVSEPLAAILKRAGYQPAVEGGREGVETIGAAPPDALILDRDLPAALYQQALEALRPRTGTASFPLLILGGGAPPPLPAGWHEDAALSLSRPPQPAEVLASLRGLLRLAFYRLYRDLVHDLSQPVTSIHALSQSISRATPAEAASRASVDLLRREADRLMTLLEEFQRKRASR